MREVPQRKQSFSSLFQSKDDFNESEDFSVSIGDSEERDELREIQRMTYKDTKRVRNCRYVAIGMLLMTAICLTFTAYQFLKQEHQKISKTAYKEISRTIHEAAIKQQINIGETLSNFANMLTAYAQGNNINWPYFSLPLFQSYAERAMKQANIEVLAILPMVKHEERIAWTKYVSFNYEQWVREGHFLESGSVDRLQPIGYHPFISKITKDGVFPETHQDYYFPFWLYSPPPSTYGMVNLNLGSVTHLDGLEKAILKLNNETLTSHISVGTNSEISGSLSQYPHSVMLHPIYKRVEDYNSKIVGLLGGAIAWDSFFQNLLPEGDSGIYIVLRNTCNQTYTYKINGPTAIYLGEGDMHEAKFSNMEMVTNLALSSNPIVSATPGHCEYSMHIYPSSQFYDIYHSNTPGIFAAAIATTFVLLTIVLVIYELLVQRRIQTLTFSAAKSNAIVSSMFPSQIRDKLLTQSDGDHKKDMAIMGHDSLKTFLESDQDDSGNAVTTNPKPLAELFLNTSVMFADIVGFTAWSSTREPSQIFTFLETLYGSFDIIAKKRQIFKVETVGDCYVAVAGIPHFRIDHAINMIRFARDIMIKMNLVTKELEVTLGPTTASLSLRIGIHSGPVTGGVLRGDRSRFQLFGDTMNTASRMESTGKARLIHVSKETAAEVIKAGRGNWLQKREEAVIAKGKGQMETYWASISDHRRRYSQSSNSSIISLATEDLDTLLEGNKRLAGEGIQGEADMSAQMTRLINWNVETLLRLITQIVAHRKATTSRLSATSAGIFLNPLLDNGCPTLELEDAPLHEVKEIITLPRFDVRASARQLQQNKLEQLVTLPPAVVEQVQDYVTCIAKMYRDNPFHNFDHASHVVSSVTKLMSRIVAPSDFDIGVETKNSNINNNSNHKKAGAPAAASSSLHDHTYGITSDPLTQLACVFSALIHDVDHPGVPNMQLVKENALIASVYKNRSVAEQNSLDIAWNLLMNRRYADMRACLFSTKADLRRFRQLVVNSVMATDIVDKELKALRNERWDKAFKQQHNHQDTGTGKIQNVAVETRDDINRKATIVIEHLIQASDVAHTMQHWRIYREWNEKLFHELQIAYQAGRGGETNPAKFWYEGEMAFFDYYIIPLAKKLKDCGVFGISSDEYLSYALNNRKEWEEKGEEVVAKMIQKLNDDELGNKQDDTETTLG